MQPNPRLRDPRLETCLECDGYAVLDDFLNAAEIAHLEEVFHTHDSPIHRAAFSASPLSHDVQYRSAVDRAIKAVIAPNVDAVFNGYRLCFTNFVLKHPQGKSAPDGAGEVKLHQDIGFVDEARFQSLAIWCPLVDTDEVNGCLYVVPGSQRYNTGPRGPGTVYPYRELDTLLQARWRQEPMKAGSAMIFCQKLFHASPPNRSASVRVAIGSLYVPRDAQLLCYYPDPGTPNRMDVFAVDDLFYTRYIYRSRPEGVPRVGAIDYWYERIGRDQLAG